VKESRSHNNIRRSRSCPMNRTEKKRKAADGSLLAVFSRRIRKGRHTHNHYYNYINSTYNYHWKYKTKRKTRYDNNASRRRTFTRNQPRRPEGFLDIPFSCARECVQSTLCAHIGWWKKSFQRGAFAPKPQVSPFLTYVTSSFAYSSSCCFASLSISRLLLLYTIQNGPLFVVVLYR